MFRPFQELAVEAQRDDKDVEIVLPTGAGKSLCFQLPAVLRDRDRGQTTLVVSPLVALMRDQVRALRARGVSAACVYKGMDASERTRALHADARHALLYVSPERLALPSFRRRLAKLRVGRIVVDEAHCVSEWGHDFRPTYLQIGGVRQELGVPITAATATLTPRARQDMRKHLGMRDPIAIAGSLRRNNLSLAIERWRGDTARVERISELLDASNLGKSADGPRAIVYAATRKRVVAIARALSSMGFLAGHYHAGRTVGSRERAQSGFETDRHRVLVATSAFGMGVDLPDVRAVFHAESPSTLEAYFQQAGRAGRDGQPSRAVLLYGPKDDMVQRRLRGETPHAGALEGWKALKELVMGDECRALAVERWFGQETEARCEVCDVCMDPAGVAASVDLLRSEVRARRVRRVAAEERERSMSLSDAELDHVVAFVDGMRRPLGRRVVAAGLRGSRSKRAKREKLEVNDLFGVLRGMPESVVLRGIDDLLLSGRLAPKGKKYPTVWMPDKRVRPPRTTKNTSDDAPRGLEAALRAFRKTSARKRRWKAYQVFPNAVIAALVAARPSTSEALRQVRGLGPRRIEKFGDELLRLIREYETNKV